MLIKWKLIETLRKFHIIICRRKNSLQIYYSLQIICLSRRGPFKVFIKQQTTNNVSIIFTSALTLLYESFNIIYH